MKYPRQEECDMSKPEEHAVWALVCPPVVGTTPMLIPTFVAKKLSAALWRAGFRHHPELQEQKVQRAYRGPQGPLNGMTKWVPMSEVDPDPVILPNLAEMTVAEREAVIGQARALGMVPEVPTPVTYAQIENGD